MADFETIHKEKTVSDDITLVIETRIRKLVKEDSAFTPFKAFKFEGAFFAELDNKVERLVKEAAIRAESNGRVTIKAGDL